jgi:gamma-glutamyl-gamma-aminobutyrate hydrolase PuuD
MRVFIVGNDSALQKLWQTHGHEVVHKFEHAEVVQFIGGADVDPSFYGERTLKGTHISAASDRRDQEIWNKLVPAKHFAVGVCRGGQFLNVMNGGSMWQHVSGHAGSHKVHDVVFKSDIMVTSTHHQMMIPSEQGEILAYTTDLSSNHLSDTIRSHDGVDPEVVWYERTRCLCFQPHPEYAYASGECVKYFFDLIELLR